MANPNLEDLLFILNHVFLPPKLPQEDDTETDRDIALCRLVYKASLDFTGFLPQRQQQQWSTVRKMLKTLLETTQTLDKDKLAKSILRLEDGGVLVLHIRAQNAALIIRRLQDTMIFEAFEVSPTPGAVMEVDGKLICSYPGPAVLLPLDIAHSPSFVEQLVSFLVQMNVDQLDTPTTTKARSKVSETRSTTHPRYITQLLTMILYGMGKEADVKRITKRVADDVCWHSATNPWRRSPLWLVLRVAIQTTADSRETYKEFMVFFQTELLRLFLKYDLSSELLYAARVKTSRRAYKLGDSASPRLLETVGAVGREIEHCLQARWSKRRCLQAISPSYTPDLSAIEKDTTITLLESRDYLTRVLSPDPYPRTSTTFHPRHISRLYDIDDFHDLCPDGLTKAAQVDSYLALADLEFLVQERLDGWVTGNSGDKFACETLGSCLEQYISIATKQYSSNPESQSLMLLTIMELWVALDTIALVQCPLLSSYSPEIPSSILDSLLLRRAKSMERAARIERYLRSRHSAASCATSIYSKKLDNTAFAVRYFQRTPSLQALKESIERYATDTRVEKLKELGQMNTEHERLSKTLVSRSCDYSMRGWHSPYCSKCELRNRVSRMDIEIHEWPLPVDGWEGEATVFEVKCPPVFAIWRTRTYQILRDIGMAHIQSKSSTSFLLERYEGLANWSKGGTSGRITFGSEEKSFRNSHYRRAKIPAEEDSVCVNNGLRFKLYDQEREENVRSSFNLNLDSYCTLRLPEGLYKHLQYAVAHTTHTHNETIANQGDCPVNLSMHEQLAFSNLRCGPQLQWMNIARELRANILTFSREEVHSLITQAAWQIGPLSDNGWSREWHAELRLPGFGHVLIREAEDLLLCIEANWMEGTTVKSIIYLISRLLASTADSQWEDGYKRLRKARDVTKKWMREIVKKLQDAVDDNEISELQRRACEIAATCRATFDVDPGIHLDALLSSSADVAILAECAIVIHDNTPPHLGKEFPDFQKLLHRDRRLSHMLELTVSKLIQADQRGLDTAIASAWAGYLPGDKGWTRLPWPNSRWLMSHTASGQEVHYNMLDGELLVGGKPLGRLPREITGHLTYRRIFDKKVLDVIPADMRSGMDYMTRSPVCGYEVLFALRGSESLIIRAKSVASPGQIFELIPHTIILTDFPTHFATKHAHWMDIDTGEVEFRPLDQRWEPSPQNWRLVFLPDGRSKMMQETRSLVDIQSKTFKDIAARIRNLEYPEYLTIVSDEQHRISIDLPRFRLSFFLSGGELESKNMPGMVIDHNQCTGTMIGLSSQLVLRHKDPIFAGLPRSRHVLIPYGDVHFSLSPDRNHVRVRISTRTLPEVKWHKYEIDSDLGLLVGNVSLTSRLYRIYLHALCSHPLPDPLTSQTGTDHALQELSAAGCFSFQRLTATDVGLLRLIGSITPCRRYYPKHLRVMQTTEWSPNLSALSQHGAFKLAVCSILEYAQSLAIFPELKDEEINLDYHHGGDPFLMERAMRRNAVYYEGGHGVDIPPGCDQNYHSRDSPHDADHDSNGIQAMNTSRLVIAWPAGLTRYIESSELLEAFKEWGRISGVVPGVSLKYTKEWLDLNLSEKFLTIYDLCRLDQGSSMKFELVFSFSALAYGMPSLCKFIPVLLAFATMDTSCFVDPPSHSSYELADGFDGPAEERVRRIIVSGKIKPSYHDNSDSDVKTSKQKINDAVDHLMKHWCSTPLQSPFSESASHWLRPQSIMSEVEEYFASCSRNRDLSSFALRLTEALQRHYIAPASVHIPRFSFMRQFDANQSRPHSPLTFASLLFRRTNPAPLYSAHECGSVAIVNPKRPGQPIDTSHLGNLISKFKRHDSHSDLTRLYSERLERSRREIDLHGQLSSLPTSLPPLSSCLAYRDYCQRYLHSISSAIRSSLEPSTVMDHILSNAGLWPRIHPRAMLHPLASASNTSITREWTKNLSTFAHSFIEYQFSQRLVTYAHRSESDNFCKEAGNASFNWSEKEGNSDWLLIQIQGNFITRALQSQVAKEMIMPSSGSNTVLQLNMGEGKSSVIVPLVAVALADSHKLVRIIVLEPLVGQMFHLLVERISGLTNRRVFYLPFSRDMEMDVQQVHGIRSLFEECARVQGVLVAQPKHILSFQLRVIDRTLSSGSRLDNVAQELQKVQTWLASSSRDVLDESDELLHVRYQLIYTMDEQRPLDNAPDRWTITQNVFDLVRRHAGELHHEFPEEVELLNRGANSHEGNFSHVRLLGTSAAQKLVSLIAEDSLNGRLENLTFVGLGTLRNAVLRFITECYVDDQTRAKVEDSYSKSSLWKGLLLLRGLLAHGILVHVLSRQRWRVDYGLDPKRSLLAVPYRAKDVPSMRSDFGHPDVAVCLTCLSYYYGGLTPSQVRECFDLLFKLDNPNLEYEKWVKRGGKEFPGSFRQLIGVNTNDVQTFTHDIVPVFQHNQAIIDFFLSQVVFPKEAKEFLFKLGTSGWDLAKRKANFTTGFSGTNDNSDLLPTSISQSDPVNQLRMNAQVLGYLLRPENDRYICTQVGGTKGQPCSVVEFLGLLVREPKEIRVLLDVGAQMLKMTNKQLVKEWLSLKQPDVAAGIFFDDADMLSVLSHDGVVEPLYSSPFSQRLNECIVYLDDAHTRGTDLKLPLNFRAMVTLGPKVTKDRLVQGCMRMRKLGHGQSVVFCAPPDIDRRIRKAERIRRDSDPVKVIDILSWVMSNTCIDIERHIPHWVQQGVDYHHRQTADSAFPATEADIDILRNAWLQPAARSLDEMYSLSTNGSLNTTKHIQPMQERLRKLGVTTLRDVRMEEEQEREVSHEVEQEQQIERPPKVTPAVHHLDEKVRRFVQHGTICSDSDTFFPLMTPLRSEFDAVAPQNPWSRQPRVLCTRDFMTTTEGGKEKSVVTDYLRPLNWIVSHMLQDGSLIFVVMSPFEVNRLLQDIRSSKHVRLHMYAPRTTQAMKPLDDLAFYCIPPLPSGNERPPFEVRCQFNIWSGQLYLDTHETYLHLCLLLGVSSSEETGYSSVESDRFVPKRGRIKEMVDVCLFDKSPVALLKKLFGLRRKGMSYQQTHMGKILQGRLLLQEDFEG